MPIPPTEPSAPHAALPADVLGELAAAGSVRRVSARTILFRQGDAAQDMFVIEEGSIQVHFDEGKPAKTLGAGTLLGEIALLTEKGLRTATAVAATDCRMKVVDRAQLEVLARSQPELICRALQHACAYLIDSEQGLIADLRRRNRDLEQALDYLRRTQEELDATEVQAQTDELTGLYNRRCLNEQLGKAIERAQAEGAAPSILMMDLDKFKPINDTFGHAAGDIVLRQVAGVLKDTVRSTDLPCRVGGDEFAVVLAPIEETMAAEVAARLHRSIAALEIHVPEGIVRIGATLGGTRWRSGDDVASLMERADKRLYEAKETGRNCVSWEGKILRD